MGLKSFLNRKLNPPPKAEPAAPSEQLVAQVEDERKRILNAPRVPPGKPAGRCHLCGKPSTELYPLETLGGFTRYVGKCHYRGQSHVRRPSR